MDRLHNFYKTIDMLIMFDSAFIINSVNYIKTELEKVDYNELSIKAFLLYVNIKSSIDNVNSYLYKNVSSIKNIVDSTNYTYNYIKTQMNKVRIEPFENNWISISVLLKNNKEYFYGKNYIYFEDYQHIKPHESPDISENDYYNNCIQHFANIGMSFTNDDDNILESMVILKKNDKYNYRSCHNGNVMDNLNYSSKKSSISFLSIEYIHPDMKEKVVIDLPKSAYLVNNTVLSALFIKRYLEYQYENHVFDLNYKINIMDSNINMLSLTYPEMILLKEDSYDIIRNE